MQAACHRPGRDAHERAAELPADDLAPFINGLVGRPL